jgi:hypothetical protein
MLKNQSFCWSRYDKLGEEARVGKTSLLSGSVMVSGKSGLGSDPSGTNPKSDPPPLTLLSPIAPHAQQMELLPRYMIQTPESELRRCFAKGLLSAGNL